MEEVSFTEMLESTSTIARDLEALRNEHHSLLTSYAANTDYPDSDRGDRVDGSEEWDAELEEALKKEKEELVNESMRKLEEGMSEAKLMLMLANYVNSLESDKQKLKAQVKRLCSENNWLRQELTSHQQLLQETEISLCKVREEKEQLEFLLNQERRDKTGREQSPAMDIDVREEEESRLRDQVDEVSMDMDSQRGSVNGQEAVDYEVPEKIKTLHHLALQYVNQGKHDVAVPLCKKAVQELELKKGRDNPDLAAMLNVLAVIYREQGKLKEATKVLQETLDIREKVFGLQHPAVASTLNNLSVLYGKCGDFKTAEPFCRKALEIRQKLLGANHPDVAKQFTNLAILCSHLGKYDEVEYYYQRALEIYQTELGVDDPNVTKTMTNLANCYLKQGKYRAAEGIFKKVLTTVQKGETPQSAAQDASSWVLNSSPRSPTGRGREDVYLDKGGWHRANPPQSPTVSSTLKNLSAVYREQGRVDTANELEKLTTRSVLDSSQRERMNELLADHTESPPPSTRETQAPRPQKPRGSLSLNVRRLFGMRTEEQDSAQNS